MKTGNVTDAYTITAGMPITDECTQDWALVSAEVGDDGLIFEVERALDTGDSQDRVFADDSTEGDRFAARTYYMGKKWEAALRKCKHDNGKIISIKLYIELSFVDLGNLLDGTRRRQF